MPVASAARAASALTGLALAGCSGPGSACGPRDAIVERVIDGDTIVVSGGLRIRYLLVDAPESTSGRDDCYGANATQLNADLVLGKTVELDYDVECRDTFGRTLAYVTIDGQDVNRLLVERGFACVLHIPPDGDARAGEFEALEAAARAARRGLWDACDPIPCR
jgi:micrococcal nuclease